MPYQSIFSNGNLNSGLKTSFNYTPPTPVVPKFTVNSVKDVPTLNAALKAGQINHQQWMTRFRQIQTKQPTIQTGVLPNLNPFNKESVVNQQEITPVKNLAVGAYQKVGSQARYLSGPSATQKQRDEIINNQKALQAQANPQFNTKAKGSPDIFTRLGNDIVSTYQHANPFSGVHDANKLISQTQQQYGLTPNFVKTLHNANASLSDKRLDSGGLTNTAKGGAAGLSDSMTNNSNVNKVKLLSKNSQASEILIHEGLHQVWNNNPKEKQQFTQAYDKSLTPDLKNYLIMRLNPYKGFSKGLDEGGVPIPKYDLSKLQNLPTNLQNEVHSFTAEYYLKKGAADNNALTQYYKKYLNLDKAAAAQTAELKSKPPKGWTFGPVGGKNKEGTPLQGWRDPQGKPGILPTPKTVSKPSDANSSVADIINQSTKQGNSAQGLIQAEKMAKQGKSPQEIKSFLQKDAQALATQTVKGVNTALLFGTLTAPGEGIFAKTVGSKLGNVINAARGGDEGVSALINGQRAASAAKTANLADRLGSSTVKDAATPKITKIPIKSESTEVAGKVTANPDSKYIAASDKLSAQYEKDLARIQIIPHPVTQKVLQVQLDRKYQGLQADLDNTFGKTGVSFAGKATSAEPKLPRSALDSQTPAFEPRTSPATGVTEKTVPSTTTTPKTATTTAAKPVEQATVTGDKVAGSALKSESRAVEAGLVKEFPDKATYTGTSYKQDAEDAVRLLHENPEEARAIASGYKSGKNQAFNVAVRRAVESKATKEKDIDTIMRVGNSPAHTRTSEAGQTLGAEAYHADKNSPIQAVKEVSAARTTAKAKQLKQSPAKAIASTIKEIKSEPALKVSRQDWHSFISDLRCR